MVKEKPLGVPVKLVQAARGEYITCVTLNGVSYRGKLKDGHDESSCRLSKVEVTYRECKTHLTSVFIRGCQIKYILLPDKMRNSPLLTEGDVQPRQAGRGRGRGRPHGRGRGGIRYQSQIDYSRERRSHSTQEMEGHRSRGDRNVDQRSYSFRDDREARNSRVEERRDASRRRHLYREDRESSSEGHLVEDRRHGERRGSRREDREPSSEGHLVEDRRHGERRGSRREDRESSVEEYTSYWATSTSRRPH